MPRRTRFTHPIAVDTWDAHFRWRIGNDLREHTIDETWARVARAAARREGRNSDEWPGRYAAAFRDWRLLPDERLLAHAGTARAVLPLGAPVAVLNASVFVLDPHTARARFDAEGFAETAALAVRFLDDASCDSLLACCEPQDLRVGMLGVAGALSQLGVPYGCVDAVRQGAAMASALAQGCLQGTVALASERGARGNAPLGELAAAWSSRGMPPSLIDAAQKFGVRHARLTAIEPHALLARLANNASDGLDPMGTAPDLIEGHRAYPMWTSGAGNAREAHSAMQRAVQPWIDIEIDACTDSMQQALARSS